MNHNNIVLRIPTLKRQSRLNDVSNSNQSGRSHRRKGEEALVLELIPEELLISEILQLEHSDFDENYII